MMTFTKFIPVALMVGVVAALYVYGAQQLAVTALWAPFISWGLYFMAGAKVSRLHKEVIGLTGGVAFGFLTLWAVEPISTVVGVTWGLPATVMIAAFLIVMLELTDWFELAPAYFFAYAGYFAFLFGGFAGVAATPLSATVPFWILLMVGLGLGIITGSLRKIILSKQGILGSAQKTVFDKE